jgi:hypothetical protein
MKDVHCKHCPGEVIGWSDGLTFFDGFKPVDELTCSKCGSVKKLHTAGSKPKPIGFSDVSLQIRLT